jgi:hypothetical protein
MLAMAFVALVAPRDGQAQSAMTGGLVAGDYVRLSGGMTTPINANGSLKQWDGGQSFNVTWENWDDRGGRLGLFAFGLYGDLTFLKFDDAQFKADFLSPFGPVQTASAKRARIIQAGVNARMRIPMPLIMPSISLGFGFLDWHPGEIAYTAQNGSATAKQQNRQGGVVSVMGSVDRNIYDRVGIFGEALYAYGFTSFGQTLAASGSACIRADCDLLKNTALGAFRFGLRVRASR